MIFCSDLVNETQMLINDGSLPANNYMTWVRAPRSSYPCHLWNNHCFFWLLAPDIKTQFHEENKESSCKQRLARETPCSVEMSHLCLLGKVVIYWYPHSNKCCAEFNMYVGKQSCYKTVALKIIKAIFFFFCQFVQETLGPVNIAK